MGVVHASSSAVQPSGREKKELLQLDVSHWQLQYGAAFTGLSHHTNNYRGKKTQWMLAKALVKVWFVPKMLFLNWLNLRAD